MPTPQLLTPAHGAPGWRRALCAALAVVLGATSLPAAPAWAQLPASPSASALRHAPLDLHHLDLAAFHVPEPLGYVAETWQPTDHAPAALVVHLQDLHTQPAVQRHQSELIGWLHDSLGIQLVALEGAAGPLDTTIYSDFPDPPTTAKIARLFVTEGLFTGAEYYAVTHPQQVTLWGVEDEALYLEHLATYQRSADGQPALAATLTQLRTTLTPLRQMLYPQTLQTFLTLRDAYEHSDKDGAFRPYVQELLRLATAAQLDLAAYPHLDATARAYALADALHLPQVETEQRQLLERLWLRLTATERRQLTQLSQAITTQQDARLPYYETLTHLAHAHGVEPQRYPAFQDYVTYLQLSHQLQSGALVQELETLDAAVEQAALTTAPQRALARLLTQVELLDELIHVQLSPDRWRRYQQERAGITVEALLRDLQSVTMQPPVTRAQLEHLITALPAQERFYELAHQRDAALVKNTLAQLTQQRAPAAAILITGGFHTAGLTAQLQQHDIAYVVITPKLGAAEASPYQTLLSGQMPAFDTLWQQVQTMLLPPVLGEAPVTVHVPTGLQPPPAGASTPRQPVRTSSRNVKVYCLTALAIGLMVAAGITAAEAWGQIVQAVPRITDYLQPATEGGQFLLQASAAPLAIGFWGAPRLVYHRAALTPPVGLLEAPPERAKKSSRGFSGLDNTIYTPAIQAKLDAGAFFAVEVQNGRFVPTTILHETTEQAIGRQASEEQLRLLNTLPLLADDVRLAEGARVFFIEGLDQAVEGVLHERGERAPPAGCSGSHYGRSRHQYYLDGRHLPSPQTLVTHLHHEVQERAAVLTGEDATAVHARLQQEEVLAAAPPAGGEPKPGDPDAGGSPHWLAPTDDATQRLDGLVRALDAASQSP